MLAKAVASVQVPRALRPRRGRSCMKEGRRKECRACGGKMGRATGSYLMEPRRDKLRGCVSYAKVR